MAYFKRSELQRFVNMREKSPPPVFVGRKSVLSDVLTIAAQTRQERFGIPGCTTVIQGAPGAGKSSVLSEIDRLSLSANARVVKITSDFLQKHTPKALQRIAFAAAAEPVKWQEAIQQFGTKWGQRVGRIELMGFSANLASVFTDEPPSSLITLEERLPSDQWGSTVILAIDEAQRFTGGYDTPHANVLQTIHDAENVQLPLTLVLAGLGDTQSVIRSMGLTHGISPYSLGCFSVEELHELTEGWSDHFHIKIGSCRSQIDALMAKTDGWPRHVHWAQQALAEALLVKGVDGHADKIEDWNAVQRRSDKLRHGYYDAQYSEVMKYSPQLTAQILQEVGKAERTGKLLNTSQLRQRIKAYCDTDPLGNFEYPPEHTANTFITQLMHCGALTENPATGVLTCPIPSFQNYILRRGGLDPASLEQTLNKEVPLFKKESDDSYASPEPKPPGYEDDDPDKIP